MNNRDEEQQNQNLTNQSRLAGVIGGFLGQAKIVLSVVEEGVNQLVSQGPTIEEIHAAQSSVLKLLFLQNALLGILGLLFYLTTLLSFMQPYINNTVFLIFGILYFFTLLLAQFAKEQIKQKPHNITLFIFHLFFRFVFFLLMAFKYGKFIVALFVVQSLNIVINYAFFKYDEKHTVEQCFQVKNQYLRIIIVIFSEIILFLILFRVTSVFLVLLFVFIFTALYIFLILHVSLIETRIWMMNHVNEYYLATVMYDRDIFFPCEFFYELFQREGGYKMLW